MGLVHRTNVEIDGAPFGQNASYTYLHAELPPGRHSITVRAENTDTLEFDAEAGKNYFVQQQVKLGWITPRTELHLVPESDGREGVGGARLAAPTYRTDDAAGAKAVGLTVGILGALLSIVFSAIGHVPAFPP